MGTPVIFLILLFKSLSHVATMKHRCILILFTIQSSAYVPLWSQVNLSNLGSFDNLNANLVFYPNFSNSATTQSDIYGMHFPNKQSIEFLIISNLLEILKLMKLVSIRILYGGPREGLCLKNKWLGSYGLLY